MLRWHAGRAKELFLLPPAGNAFRQRQLQYLGVRARHRRFLRRAQFGKAGPSDCEQRGAVGAALNYVLNADAFIVADSGDGPSDFHVGLALNQVQFSTIRGAASARNGWALWLGGGYTIANTIQGIDLEESLWCVVNDSRTSAHNTFISPYLNCPYGLMSTNGDGNVLLNPLFAGATAVPTQITAGFKIMQ